MTYGKKARQQRRSKRLRVYRKRIRGLKRALARTRRELEVARAARFAGPLARNRMGVFVDHRKQKVLIIPDVQKKRTR